MPNEDFQHEDGLRGGTPVTLPQHTDAESLVIDTTFAEDYALGSITVFLGLTYSAAQMLEAQALLTFVKEQGIQAQSALGISNLRQMRQAMHNTRLVDALNRGRKWALKRLSTRLAPMLVEDSVIIVVPSHDPWQQQTPIRMLAQQIASQANLIDGTGCLVRYTKITRIVFGGPSTSAVHRGTIQVQHAAIFKGRQVLLIDDITKSGNSLTVCHDLLQEAGATVVRPVALGKVSSSILPDLPSFRLSFFKSFLDNQNGSLVNTMPSRVIIDNKQAPATDPVAGLEPVPGDTYPLRAELKALGAVWDAATRVWHIVPEKLPLAKALVEHQALVPPKTLPTDAKGEVIDPFEEDAQAPRVVTLSPEDGADYEHRDTLRAVGARWDKAGRAWTIREERADYARAVLRAVVEAPEVPASSPAPREQEDQTETEVGAKKKEVASVSLPSAPQDVAARARGQRSIGPGSDTPVAEFSRASVEVDVKATAKLIKLGGLWISRSKSGRTFLSAKLTPNVRLLIFKNQFKTTDAQPDYEMYVAPVTQEDPPPAIPSVPQDLF